MTKKVGILSALSVVLVLMTGAGIVSFINLHRHIVSYTSRAMEPTIHDKQTLMWKPYDTGKLPRVGDIVLYMQSGLQKFSHVDSAQLADRVVALPGDHVVIANNKLMVINTTHSHGYQPAPFDQSKVVISGSVDLTVAPGHYYVLGDNAPMALDSRAFGVIDINTIKGYVDLSSSVAQAINQHK
jgi:signal peptidase I